MPDFQFHFSYRHLNNGLITVGDEVIHRIMDVDTFYNELGYTDSMRNIGLSFDEFIEFEYRNDNCNKPKVCLQAKIVNYLIKYSSTFLKKYAGQYENWLGGCSVKKLADSAGCVDCILHPNQLEHEYFNCMTNSEVTFYSAYI